MKNKINNMPKAQTLTNVSIVVGVIGILSLIGAWLAGESGLFLGFSQKHLFADAGLLLLIAIWLKLGAIYHKG